MAELTPPTSPAHFVAEGSTSTPPADVPINETSKPKSNNEEPLPDAQRVVRPSDSHRCPLHETAEECMKVHIKPENEEITSRLIGPIKITFSETPEQLRAFTRGNSNMLPSILYRTFYEISATLSSRVSKDTHVRHRENEGLRLREGNAFQTVGEVKFENNLTKEGIERHLVWNKKLNPSTWISMFDKWEHAERRAKFHYKESKRIGQRVTVAMISTADYIAATVHAECESIWEILTRQKYFGKKPHYSSTIRQVAIPVWVHKSVRPEDGSAITAEQLMASNADLMVSIEELRKSNLVLGPKTHSRRRTITADGHNYEWLALGRILESRIIKVIPFDGTNFYHTKPSYTVRSEDATDDWVFDFNLETWRLESEMKKAEALERKGIDSDDADAKAKKKQKKSASLIHKNTDDHLDFSIITTIIDSF